MIQYALVCEAEHRFDAWFRSGAAYQDQAGRGLLSCPVCHSPKVEKAMMAPALAKGAGRSGADAPVALSAHHPGRARMLEALRTLRREMTESADYVGPRFADEARRMHFGEADPRGIYGEATQEEARALAEDGVAFMPLPALPDEHN